MARLGKAVCVFYPRPGTSIEEGMSSMVCHPLKKGESASSELKKLMGEFPNGVKTRRTRRSHE